MKVIMLKGLGLEDAGFPVNQVVSLSPAFKL